MKVTKLKNILDGMSTCTAYYRKVPTGTKLPFLVWYINRTDNFDADNKVYKRQCEVIVDLYTAQKDFQIERELEGILEANELVWNSSEATVGEEATVVNSYEIWTMIEK